MKYNKSMNQQVLEGVIVQLVIYFLLIFFVNMHITIKKKRKFVPSLMVSKPLIWFGRWNMDGNSRFKAG